MGLGCNILKLKRKCIRLTQQVHCQGVSPSLEGGGGNNNEKQRAQTLRLPNEQDINSDIQSNEDMSDLRCHF